MRNRRVQVAPLEQPNQLRAPGVPDYPTPRVQHLSGGHGLAQVAEALADLNPALARLGATLLRDEQEVGTEAGEKFAIENPELAKTASKLKFKEAIEQGIIPEGASPYFIIASHKQHGEQEALFRYAEELRKVKPQIIDPTPGKAADLQESVVATRKRFLESLGDNFYVRQGASAAISHLEQRFITEATHERVAAVESYARDTAARLGQEYVRDFARALKSTDTENAEMGRHKLIDHINKLYETFKDPKRFYAEIVHAVAMEEASVDRSSALRLVEEMKNLPLNGQGATLGSGEVNLVFDQIEQSVNARSDQLEHNARIHKRHREEEAGEKADLIIHPYLKSLNEFGDMTREAGTELLKHLFAEYPESESRIRRYYHQQFDNARASISTGDPRALEQIKTIITDGDLDTAEKLIVSLREDNRLTPSDATKVLNQIKAKKDVSSYMTPENLHGPMQELMGMVNLAGIAHPNSKKGPQIFDSFGIRDLQPQIQSIYTKQLQDDLEKARLESANHKEFEGKIGHVSRETLKKVKPQVAELIEKRAAASAQRQDLDTAAPDRMSLISPKLRERIARSQENAQANLPPWQEEIEHRKARELRKEIRAKAEQLVNELNEGGVWLYPSSFDTVWISADFLPLTDAQRKYRESTYFQLRAAEGYTHTEILRKMTNDGIEIDFKQVRPFATPLFHSMQALEKYYEQWHEEAGDERTVFGKMLKQFGVNDSDPEEVLHFVETQRRLLRLR